jgi:hypothetical protein
MITAAQGYCSVSGSAPPSSTSNSYSYTVMLNGQTTGPYSIQVNPPAAQPPPQR